jgi:hypothetical protein
MPNHPIRRIALIVALASLSSVAGAAAAQGSPRQAIPNAAANDATADYGIAYYGATTAYQRSLYYCDQKPPELQDACRDTADARYGYPSDGYRNELAENYPAYLTYSYPRTPDYVAYYDPTMAEYHFNWRYPGDTSTRNVNTNPRCAPLSGAAKIDCLHGGAPGG